MKNRFIHTENDEPVGSISTFPQEEPFKQLTEAKENFRAMISHELKTPLAILKGYLQYMEVARPVDKDEWCLYVKKALEQEERLAAVINNLINRKI